MIPDTLRLVRLLLAACVVLGALSFARADEDANALREDGVLYFQDNLPDPVVLAVKAPTVIYSRRDFGTQLGLFLPGQKIEIVGMSPEGYLVKGDYRNNAVTGWIMPAALPPGLDPKVIERVKKNQERHDKVAKAIKARRVLRGMTEDEVQQALGRPEQTSSHSDDSGQSMTWTFTSYASEWQTAPVSDIYGRTTLRTYLAKVPVGQMIVTFTNGIVTALEEHKTDPNSPAINAGG